MVTALDIEQFLNAAQIFHREQHTEQPSQHAPNTAPILNISPILDVRTPDEFEQGHIPGAINLPLFTNDERAIVGTAYKQRGRTDAILLGLDFVGGKMRSLVEAAQEAARKHNTNTVCIHCWRGGMRSGSVAWLLDMVGLTVFTLKGGYKAFRHYALDSFAAPQNVVVLGGKTGSGKTRILHALRERGEQTIDLEALAHHNGSAFGALGKPPQPTQEQFENELAVCWRSLDAARRVWLEDESKHIGRSFLPVALWEQMRAAPTLFLDVPFELRVQTLLEDYNTCATDEIAASVSTIERRLGGLATRHALEALEQNDRAETARIALRYYDKAYLHGLSQRTDGSVRIVPTNTRDVRHNGELVLAAASTPPSRTNH